MRGSVEAILARQSVRKFLSDPVPQSDLLEILTAAVHAPSGGNRQAWLFVAVRNASILRRIADIISNRIDTLRTLHPKAERGIIESMQQRYRRFSLFFVNAPAVIYVFYNPSASNTMAMFEAEGLSEAEAERESGYVEVQSAAAAVENMLLAADSLGYGACWMNPPHFARKGISDLLGVGDPFRLLAMVPIGRPSEKRPKVKRKSVQDVTRFIE